MIIIFNLCLLFPNSFSFRVPIGPKSMDTKQPAADPGRHCDPGSVRSECHPPTELITEPTEPITEPMNSSSFTRRSDPPTEPAPKPTSGEEDIFPADIRSLIQARSTEGETPLHHAAVNCKTQVIDYLLRLGADPESKDNEDTPPQLYQPASAA